MSWDKNTIIVSGLGAVKNALDSLNTPYKLSELKAFQGRGANDGWDIPTIYKLHRLEFGNQVILEYAKLDADCDVDDLILAEQFNLEDEPKDWEPIRYTDITDDHPDWKGVP